MKFNLGSGPNPLHDFICIDLIPGIDRPDFINWDLCKGLPPQCANADMITSCHVFEHFKTQDAIALMRQCHSALRDGGVFRMGVPNFKDMVINYLNNNWSHWDIIEHDLDRYSNPQTRTIIDICEEGVYQADPNPANTHKSIWDVPKAIKILEYVGFKDVKRVLYDYNIDPPMELRRRYTLVVEGTK